MAVWIAEIGGFFSSVYLIAGLVVIFLEKPLLKYDIFKRLYLIKKSTDEEKIAAPDESEFNFASSDLTKSQNSVV